MSNFRFRLIFIKGGFVEHPNPLTTGGHKVLDRVAIKSGKTTWHNKLQVMSVYDMCIVPDDAAVNGAEAGVLLDGNTFESRPGMQEGMFWSRCQTWDCSASEEGPFSQSLSVRRWLTESETVRRRGKPMAGS